MAPQHIIIIGAGIVGASIAHRLSLAGAKITIIDRAQAPGLGVSAASFGWITCAAGDPGIPEDVYRQRLQAIDDYTLLDREFGGRLCAPLRGAMVWGASEAETRDWAHRHAEKKRQSGAAGQWCRNHRTRADDCRTARARGLFFAGKGR